MFMQINIFYIEMKVNFPIPKYRGGKLFHLNRQLPLQ